MGCIIDKPAWDESSKKRIQENLQDIGEGLDEIGDQIIGADIDEDVVDIFEDILTLDDESFALSLIANLGPLVIKWQIEGLELDPHPKFELLDQHTKFYFNTLKTSVENHEKLKTSEISLPLPKSDDLDYQNINAIQGLRCLKSDEDHVEEAIHLENIGLRYSIQAVVIALVDRLEVNEEPIYFENEEEPKALFDQHFSGGRTPQALETFDDFESEETMSNIAFYGIGQIYLKKVEDLEKRYGNVLNCAHIDLCANHINEIAYEVDTSVLSTFEVRPGYEMYGANAFFGKDKSLLEIYVCELGKIVKPGDSDWMHAKWIWRCSLITLVTAGPHLTHVHWVIANSAHIGSRTMLDANHPIRRILKPFLYNTGAINMQSTFALAPEYALLHRMTGLTYEGFKFGLSHLFDSYTYETLPDLIASKKLGQDMEDQIPLCADGLPIWNAFQKFFQGYVDFFYKTNEDVNADKVLEEFWDVVEWRGKYGCKSRYGLPELNKEGLVEYLTHFAFSATVWHELAGTIVQYLISPKGGCMKLRAGSNEADIQAYVQDLILIGMTGMPEPLLMDDWSHLLPDEEEIMRLYNELKVELDEISRKVDKANETRPHACQSFNPKYLECSVSV